MMDRADGRAWDLVNEAVILAAHVETGIGMISGPAASAIGRPNERLPGVEAFDGNTQVQGCQLRKIVSLQSDLSHRESLTWFRYSDILPILQVNC